jgi:hypothetical protein
MTSLMISVLGEVFGDWIGESFLSLCAMDEQHRILVYES